MLFGTAWLSSRYTREKDFLWVFAWYVAAKLFEVFDKQIWALGNLVSGHTLKHLAAGIAGLVICRILLRRAVATVPVAKTVLPELT